MKGHWLICAAVLAMGASAAHGAPPSFQGLGDLPGGYFFSHAYDVSDDGSVVVGYSNGDRVLNNGYQAFRWTASTGMVPLGASSACGVSADGTVVVGGSDSNEAYRWTAAGGVVSLGDLPGGNINSSAYDVSADGSTVVGYGSTAEGKVAIRWTQPTGMVQLAGWQSDAQAVSADGSVVVGHYVTSGKGRPFRWTQTTGVVDLGQLPIGSYYASAYGVSSDGAVVVGDAASMALSADVAFRWTRAEGMVALSNLDSVALDASADGSMVVGYFGRMFGSGERTAFVWDKQHGMRYLKDVLEDECGLNLDGWRLSEAWAISPDALTIVGMGWNPDHNEEAFLAHLPEPATLLVIGFGAMGLLLKPKRR